MKADKNIENFTKYIINEAAIESPSSDFLNKVMDSVKIESELSLSKKYQPLISKKVWVLIAVAFITLSIFLLTGSTENYDLISKVDFSLLDKLPSINIFDTISSVNIFKNIHFSNTFTFSFIFFSILVFVQLFVIKNYINKEIS
ncbi:MAG: hypothetical protein GQ540_12170 [Lutibacter sp.]|uniref:hypothetical protein n=1 Tax=Lutibacter sp. TaxID=1925666 RepID=UPI0019E03FBD|nr:hypothetical protein [Lutibacter sp.]NOR29274.1 hypothetical protein [Lutibacter sp.]